MTDMPNPFVEKLAAAFHGRLERVIEQRDEITLEVAAGALQSRDHRTA